jgi:hypothetical protein
MLTLSHFVAMSMAGRKLDSYRYRAYINGNLVAVLRTEDEARVYQRSNPTAKIVDTQTTN